MSDVPVRLSAHDVRRLAVHLHRDPRAIKNAYRGTAKAMVREHVREGAQQLGLPPPPDRRTEPRDSILLGSESEGGNEEGSGA